MNLDRFKDWMLSENYSIETIKGYERYLKQIRDDIDLEEMDEYFKIARYLHDSDLPRSQKNNIAKAANAYLRMKGEDYRLKLDKRKGPRDIWIPSKEQAEKLLEVNCWKNRFYNERNSLLLKILFEAGLRAEEASNLRFSDIKRKKDQQHCYIHVREGKGGKDRLVPISKDLYEDIEHFEKYYSSSEYIFDNGRGKGVHPKTVRQICYQAAEATEDQDLIDNFHPHAARHYRAVQLVENDINLEAVRRFLGHSSLETTKEYLRGSDSLLFDEFEKKDPIFTGGI
ncbi:MAG: tyrosine-type recombinase/integrase [Thermoplasmata archaeon]